MDLFVHELSLETPGLVRVEGAGVSGWCRWFGTVDVGTTAGVELDVGDEVTWSCVDIDEAVAPISLAQGTMELRGQIADVDESSTVTLILPQGSVVLVDTVGEVPLHIVTKVVRMHVRDATAYPTQY